MMGFITDLHTLIGVCPRCGRTGTLSVDISLIRTTRLLANECHGQRRFVEVGEFDLYVENARIVPSLVSRLRFRKRQNLTLLCARQRLRALRGVT